MTTLAIIGGSGAGLFPLAEAAEILPLDTKWGAPSAPLYRWEVDAHTVYFLSRHGAQGSIPPHRVNYRANIQALADINADWVVASHAVGGIGADAVPGVFAVPHQLIDYTWGRAHSFYDGEGAALEHVEMTQPFDEDLRQLLVSSANTAGVDCLEEGVYGVTQGPRLETAAEINRMENDGCSLVGMTAMPEAALAREAGLRYASCSNIVNFAAGRSAAGIHVEIDVWLAKGVQSTARVLAELLKRL